jgi:hypothetical protein
MLMVHSYTRNCAMQCYAIHSANNHWSVFEWPIGMRKAQPVVGKLAVSAL